MKEVRTCNCILNGGTIPASFLQAAVKLLFKKGDKNLCTNYRTLSLNINSSPYKILVRMIEFRLRTYCQSHGLFSKSTFR